VQRSIGTLAIHVCADVASAGPDQWWPATASADDTVQRASRICRHLGIAEQCWLSSEHASRAALLGALREAGATLSNNGLLVLTYAGHSVRGDGPIESTRWCLFDGELEITEIAAELARLPAEARLVIITDTCYAAAIARTLVGAQETLVLASCGEDQTLIDRASCELMVRLEAFICASHSSGSLDDLRRYLEHDTPDCERPHVWTNTHAWWTAAALPAPP
jgi:hypothetical protein